jgi:hypothetical protein
MDNKESNPATRFLFLGIVLSPLILFVSVILNFLLSFFLKLLGLFNQNYLFNYDSFFFYSLILLLILLTWMRNKFVGIGIIVGLISILILTRFVLQNAIHHGFQFIH